eukprot:694750-Pleurochrysis_carterae.AAC.1
MLKSDLVESRSARDKVHQAPASYKLLIRRGGDHAAKCIRNINHICHICWIPCGERSILENGRPVLGTRKNRPEQYSA